MHRKCVKVNIVNSEHDFKKHEWLVRKIANLCIIKELENDEGRV